MKKNKGILFVFSGPSGAGKGTVLNRVFQRVADLCYSVSCTTRDPRPGETDGIDYHYITPEQFQRYIDEGAFLEWADVHAHRYGTLKAHIEEELENGKDVVLEIDVQGALQVKKKAPEAVTVFIMPPSLAILEQRLRSRGTESEEAVRLRLHNAEEEMRFADQYDAVIVNDNLDHAVEQTVQYIVSCHEKKKEEEQ